ncbi:MAG TPA: UDP-N-acetylmuramate dehydrogenase [Terracidiphilus sp.]|nr:UDP-N-acetylmuramate dehydrogenase [Terracidiphilus sp.]
MLLEQNKPLAPLTTLGVGGPARWFMQAASEAEIVEAVAWAHDKNVPLFVLGGGSNLLVSDAGFKGLAMRVGLKGIERRDEGDCAVYRIAAGEDWDRFVHRAVNDGCAGVECLAGIPGTVGGTPVQNVGAYGQEVSNCIDKVRAYDLSAFIFVEFSAAECRFAYRRSRFNTVDRGRYVVTRVDYRLKLGAAPTIAYRDLQREFTGKSNPSLLEVADAVRRIRRSKGMLLTEGDPDNRSAGSFFKNPIVSEEQAQAIGRTAGQEPPKFPAGDGSRRVKLAAAWLIEQAGFSKGYVRGAAGISSRHTLALVNRGSATAAEILTLANEIASKVEERFGVRLEREPVLLGFEDEPA